LKNNVIFALFPNVDFVHTYYFICNYNIVFCYSAAALGLTAEDMMAVQDFQEEIKAKRKKGENESSTANQIKQDVAKEEHELRVCNHGYNNH